ncbi:MAG TPA: glycosyltransferase family 4 protein [Anaerolineales bacterium]|nr:glycosyltransferase family 4 protein [Anaerolineales bacterium]
MPIKLKDNIRKLNTRVMSLSWRPYSRLFLKSDSAAWVLSEEMRALNDICEQLRIQTEDASLVSHIKRQSIFFASRYELLRSEVWKHSTNRLATAYFHGKPGTGESAFDEMHHLLKEAHPHIHRIQVSHTEMQDVVLSAGIDPQKVFLIPIGIDINAFQLSTEDAKKAARLRLGIPESAVVVGSFQKDGTGWGEGNEPKLIKGPDIFLKAIKQLREGVPEIFVLLTGPSRGYVINGLREMKVPYKHVLFDKYTDINTAYQCLDLYIIASRQEGGPKAILESMATGVPLVTTRVGQAMDLVKHGENAWVVKVEDVEGLAYWSSVALSQSDSAKIEMKQSARQTAEANSYTAQIPLWEKFMEGFVEKQS